MDPGTGRLYPSVADARTAGVKNPVELTGRAEDIERISAAVMFGKTLSGRTIDQSRALVTARDADASAVPTATVICREPSSYEWAILKSLQNKRLYQGTVPDGVKAIRRTRGKIAKVSRKANRGNR